MKLNWRDIEGIGLALYEKFPDIDPLTVRFTDLQDWIAEFEEWDDDIHTSNEAKLEAVQMAWLEEYKEDD